MATSLQIKLHKEELDAQTLSYIKDSDIYVYPLKLRIFSNINLENNNANPNSDGWYDADLFVLQKSGTAFDPDQGDIFVKISGLVDLYELPNATTFDQMNNNSQTTQTPYYRVNSIELACKTLNRIDEIYNAIKKELKLFVDNYNLQNKITETETDIIS